MILQKLFYNQKESKKFSIKIFIYFIIKKINYLTNNFLLTVTLNIWKEEWLINKMSFLSIHLLTILKNYKKKSHCYNILKITQKAVKIKAKIWFIFNYKYLLKFSITVLIFLFDYLKIFRINRKLKKSIKISLQVLQIN